MEFAKSVGQRVGESLDNVPVLGKVVRKWSMSGRQIRKETFTRWCNFVLREQEVQIKDIGVDLSDGVTLIVLYSVLSGEELTEFISEPSSDKERRKNVDNVLRAMDYQSIPCDKVDTNSILQGELNAILDVLWSLFLRFELQIILGGQNLTTDLSKVILTWLQNVLGDKSIDNLLSCWCDGLALSKLVNTLKPNSLPDYEYFIKENASDNLTRAMTVAYEQFNIPVLLNASDVANNHTDEQCMVAYFSYFMKEKSVGEDWTIKMLDALTEDIQITTLAKNLNMGLLFHKLVNKLIPVERQNSSEAGTNLARIQFSMDVAKQCLGVEDIIRPEDFQESTLPRIELVAYLSQFNNVRKRKGSVSPFYRNERFLHSSKQIRVNGELDRDFCSSQESINSSIVEVSGPYTSPEPGTYVIKLFENINLDPKFPSMDSLNKDFSGITVTGRGLQEGVVNETTEFAIYLTESSGQVEVSIEDPEGKISSATLVKGEDGKVTAQFLPKMQGPYKIYIFNDGLQLQGCPYQCYATPRGQIIVKMPDPASDGNHYCNVEETYEIELHSPDTDVKDFEVIVASEDDPQREVKVIHEESGRFLIPLELNEIGEYEVFIRCKDTLLPECPILLIVNNPTLCVVHGDGLLRARLNEESEFEVDARDAGSGIFNMVIDNAKDILADVQETEANRYRVRYTPKHTGILSINLSYAGVPIRGSPFQARVVDPTAVVLSGPQPLMTKPGETCEVTFSSETSSKKEDFTILITGPVGEVNGILTIHDKLYKITFDAFLPGVYKVEVFIEGYLIRGAPFYMELADVKKPSYPDMVIVTGAIERAITDDANKIQVDVIDAGHGELTVEAEGHRKEIVLGTKMTDEGLYSVTYYPQDTGAFQMNIKWDGKHVKGSPFTILAEEANTAPPTDASKVVLSGEGLHEATREKVNIIKVDVSEAGPGHLAVEEVWKEDKIFIGIKDNHDGTMTVSYVPSEAGTIQLLFNWGNQAIPGSPLTIKVKEDETLVEEVVVVKDSDVVDAGVDVIQSETEVKIESKTVVSETFVIELSGAALEKAVVDEVNVIKLDVKGDGRKSFRAKAEGDNGPIPVDIHKIDEGSYKIRYTPWEEGPLKISLNLNGEPVEGFPRTVQAKRPVGEVDAKKIVILDGFSKNGTLKYPVVLRLDKSRAGEAELTCICTSPKGVKTAGHFQRHEDDIYVLDLTFSESGRHFLNIFWGGSPIPGSPFSLNIEQSPDPSQVKVYGEGLKDGILGEYEGKFFVQTKGAGRGTITVKINGPEGAFRVNMAQVNSLEKIICVTYNPKEEGLYFINVYWSDENVPGSPFSVNLKKPVEKEEPAIKRAATYSPAGAAQKEKEKKKRTFSLLGKKKKKSKKEKSEESGDHDGTSTFSETNGSRKSS